MQISILFLQIVFNYHKLINSRHHPHLTQLIDEQPMTLSSKTTYVKLLFIVGVEYLAVEL